MTPLSPPPTDLHAALSDLLRLHAPQATLLASVGEEVVQVRADAALRLPAADLVPPDDWFERGEMTWLTRDGALLGLLWSDGGGPVPTSAVQVLTMLLAAGRAGAAGREIDVLVTQLPMPTVWLGAELQVRGVSRPFLELFGLDGAAVLGQTLGQLFPGRPAFAACAQQAASGRAARLADEHFATLGEHGAGLWVRGDARPYFGGAVAGVMLTLQDVSPEHARTARVAALLDTERPCALLSDTGAVLHASQGLLALVPAQGAAVLGAPLWSWPCLSPLPAEGVRDLVKLAASGGAARAEVDLAGGGRLALSVRRSGEAGGLLVAEGLGGAAGAGRDGALPAGLVAQVLGQTEDATVLIDAAGRAALVSDRAAALLGVEAARLMGLGFSRVLGELGVRLFTPGGDPRSLPDWRELALPLSQEVLLALPDGSLRTMEARASAVDGLEAGSVLLTLRDLTALRRAQARVRHNARHDALTGLHNRTGLREVALAEGGAADLVVLDIDGFGALNAALGRTACDRLLIQVAARLHDLAAAARGSAARLTDDTFALLLPRERGAEARGLLAQAFAAPLRAGQREVALSFAAGQAGVAQTPLPELALGDAEIAMQHAKRQGRGEWRAYDPGMRAQVARAFELEDGLRGALGAGQLALLYQPALDLKTGRALGAEALLRWNHPTLGVLPPSHFLDLASRSDLIVQVSEWVVQRALEGRAAVQGALEGRLDDFRVSVNLNLEELRRSAGLEGLLPLLAEQGAPDIEVAAGSLLDHSQETLGLLERLRAHGARLAVDDFGDGNSSLVSLTRFPLGTIKLHPTLIARLPDDARSLALVQGTVDLAHGLGLQVIAVGVETDEQLEVLRGVGCDGAQGYAICPPLTGDALVAWLGAH